MHRDLFGDDGLVQNARAAGRQRGGAGGFAALEQLVRGDIEILRETAHGVGGRFVLLHRNHEQFQQAYLTVEYLHTRHMHGVIALMLGGHVHHGIGQDGTVVFVQGVRAGRAGDGNVVGQCLGTGGDGLSGIPVPERWDMVTMTSGTGCALLAAKLRRRRKPVPVRSAAAMAAVMF